ncbi:MAG TPA: IPT/TIG domain-containing protein [Thermoleophilaceae bacterium]
MSRRTLLLALLAIPVFFLAAIPATAKKAKASKAPVVKSIHPLKLKIGDKLTIHGSGFIKGRHKDTVVFMGAGKRVVWVKADKASTKTITVTLPTKLAVLLSDKSGAQKPTRLLVRVIARRSGRAFTKRAKSPIVSPNASIQSGTPQAEPCPGYSNANADSDGDMLSNGLELALGTNPCKADSDGDGVSDGYEYQAALDLNRNANSSAIPWPSASKRPYPNPLDPSDANTDFDGDSLTLFEEYEASFAWALGIDPAHKLQTFLPYPPNPNPYNDVMVVSYSDGDQTTNPTAQGNPIGDPTGPAAPCSPGQGPTTQSGFDVNGNGTAGDNGDVLSYQAAGGSFVDSATTPLGWMNSFNQNGGADCFLSDDEKDIDGDGLSNFTEAHGPLSGQKWWNSLVPKDGNYPVSYDGTNWLNADSDGDGILDGSDDQDHDGYTNIEESLPQGGAENPEQSQSLWHYPVENVYPNVNAFNPCLPNIMSPACPRHPGVGDTYAPIPADSPQATFNTWPRPAP